MAFAFMPVAARADTITFVSFGGVLQKGVMDAMVKPAAAAAKVRVREETLESIASVRAQVQSGAPTWDIVQLGSNQCPVGAAEGLFEPLDFGVIDVKGIPEATRASHWIGSQYYSVMLAWNTEKYKANPPKDWRDFFDTKKFPGTRSLSKYPWETLEIALLGDGVAKDALYPLDVERALRALERIKPSIVSWYTTGSQSAQLLKDGEADMIAIWGSRVAGVVNDGAPVGFTYEQGLLGFGCLAVPKGSKNKAAAMKVIAGMVSPAIQANIPSVMDFYGPVNELAFEGGRVPEELLRKSNSGPANKARQLMMDPDYWAPRLVTLTERLSRLQVQ